MSEISEAGFRITQFLEDDAIKAALQAVKQVNYDLFLKAKSDDDRRMAHAKAQCMADFEIALNAVVEQAVGERIREDKAREKA